MVQEEQVLLEEVEPEHLIEDLNKAEEMEEPVGT